LTGRTCALTVQCEGDSSRCGPVSSIRFSQHFFPKIEEHRTLVFKLIKALAKEDN
jgi:hypothetical protein